MPLFRKRPVIVEAAQFFPDQIPWPEGVTINRESQTGFCITTLESKQDHFHVVTPGDWIITGVKGEKYPCKPDIFAETYVPVEGGRS